MKKRILLCLNHLGGTELEYVNKAFADNWVVPLGPDVDAFEKALSEMQGKPVLALSSGTSAVHLALEACGVGAGDEVIVQTMTFAATANPIRYLGATPVFVDSEEETWNMDPKLLELAINIRMAATSRKPKAIVVADLYGMPAKLDEIQKIADKYGISLLEDAAEALGSKYKGEPCGSWGKYGVLSFNGNKMITTSGGGALVCPDNEAKKKALFMATQARESYPYYQHEHIGYNYRLSNISAAIGRGQMEILEAHIEHHRRLAQIYSDEFAQCRWIKFHANPSDEFNSNYWLNTILISPDALVKSQEQAYSDGRITDCQPNDNVEAIRLLLAAENIETRPLWKPLHKQPVYKNCPAFINGTSEELFAKGLCLPSGPYVTEDDAMRIARLIKESIINE